VLENPPKFSYQACVDDQAIYYFNISYNYATHIFSEILLKYDWQSKTLSTVASLGMSELPVIVTMVPVEGKVYVFLRGDNLGGNYSSLGTLVLDPATHTVKNASFSPNGFSPGSDATKGVALNGAIYIVSYRFGNNSTQPFYRYTPANDSWQELPPLSTAVWDYAVTSFQGKIFMIGGYNPQTYVPNQNVQVFNVEYSNWTPFPAPTSFPSTAACSGTGVDSRGVIYIVGPNSTQLYYPETNQWVEGAMIPTCTAPANLFSMNGRIYASGSQGDIGYDISLEYVPPRGEALWSTPSPEPTLAPTPSSNPPTASPLPTPSHSSSPSPSPSPSPSLTQMPTLEPTLTTIASIDYNYSLYIVVGIIILVVTLCALALYFRKKRK
jgi:hypothetical protein